MGEFISCRSYDCLNDDIFKRADKRVMIEVFYY